MIPAACASAMSRCDVIGSRARDSQVQLAVHTWSGAQPTSPSHASPASTTPLPHPGGTGTVVVVPPPASVVVVVVAPPPGGRVVVVVAGVVVSGVSRPLVSRTALKPAPRIVAFSVSQDG